jgi:hypothetical protein
MECLYLAYDDCIEYYHVGPIASDEESKLVGLCAMMLFEP